jgi:hypothetical protein
MPAVFDKLGVHFDYPDNWQIEDYDEGVDLEVVQVVVTSPQSAFWHLCKHPLDVDLDTLFDEGLAAMRVQYPDMEVEVAVDLTSAGGWVDEQRASNEQRVSNEHRVSNEQRVSAAGTKEEINRIYGYNVNFICLDLTITAWLRGIRTPSASYLLLCQAEDRELLAMGAVFRAMWISLIRNEQEIQHRQ